MTREEFFAKLAEAGYRYGSISVTWTLGGMTGGSCWGDRADRPVEPEPEPPLSDLDDILELICPEMTFLKYRRIVNRVVVIGTEGGGGDYYGNYSSYGKKSVDFNDLYDALVEVKAFP